MYENRSMYRHAATELSPTRPIVLSPQISTMTSGNNRHLLLNVTVNHPRNDFTTIGN